MLEIRAYNAAAAISLADYAGRALRLRRGTTRRMIATQEVIAHSQALIAKIDALVAEFARQLTSQGWLWPAHRSAPSEPEMEPELLSAAHWRRSAQQALVQAETTRDPEAHRMMHELAMQYEDLASLIETAVLRQDELGR
jgi:hypothetical protein